MLGLHSIEAGSRSGLWTVLEVDFKIAVTEQVFGKQYYFSL